MIDIQQIEALQAKGFTNEQITSMLANGASEEKKTRKKREKAPKVQTTRELTDEEMAKILEAFKSNQERALFLLGMNWALRVSDVIRLKVSDVKKQQFTIIEKKTKKPKTIIVNDQVRDLLNTYIAEYALHNSEYLFPSREQKKAKYDTKKMSSKDKKPYITRQTAHNWVVAAATKAGVELMTVDGIIGTHTMRKTFAWTLIANGASIDQVSHSLNHSDVKTTKLYINYGQKDAAKVFSNVTIGLK